MKVLILILLGSIGFGFLASQFCSGYTAQHCADLELMRANPRITLSQNDEIFLTVDCAKLKKVENVTVGVPK